MFLHRLAAGLTFVLGLGLLRVSVVWESWPVLAVGVAACVAGLSWFIFSNDRVQEHATALWTPSR